jgi:Tfp pilus assembly protein PilF
MSPDLRYQLRHNPAFTLFVVLILFLLRIDTNSSTLSPARQAFEQGENARKTGDFAAAAAAYRRAIKINPDFTKAHEQFILTTMWAATKDLEHPDAKGTKEKDDDKARAERDRLVLGVMVEVRKKLTEQYRQETAAHPDKAVYPWAMGFINVENDPHAAEAYYRAALKIDSRFAPAHADLALLKRDRGALDEALEDMRQAVEDDPGNPEYLFSYAYTLWDSNPAESQRRLTEVVEKFPHDEDAAEALYYLADQAGTPADKVRYLATLRRRFPPSKFDWASDGMERLFEIYDRSAPDKALALARKMLEARPKNDDWKNYFATSRA